MQACQCLQGLVGEGSVLVGCWNRCDELAGLCARCSGGAGRQLPSYCACPQLARSPQSGVPEGAPAIGVGLLVPPTVRATCKCLPGLPGGKRTLPVPTVLHPSHRWGLRRGWVPATGVEGTGPWQGTCSPRGPSDPKATSQSEPRLRAAFPSLLQSWLPGASILWEKQDQLYKPLGCWESGPRGGFAHGFWKEPKREEAPGVLAASRAKSGEFGRAPCFF